MDSPRGAAVRVLVAEDNEVTRGELKSFLESRRNAVTAVPDGRTARILLATEPFDLVILDYHLPHSDAFEIMEEVRRARAATVFVLMTGDVSEEVRATAKRVGADYFLAKPFEVRELEQILTAVARKRS
jgi:DNA-binding response OmpR family regulator